MSQSLGCATERGEEKKNTGEKGGAQGMSGLFPYVLWLSLHVPGLVGSLPIFVSVMAEEYCYTCT